MKKLVLIFLLHFSFSMFLGAKPLLLTEMPEQEKQFIEVISKAQKETVGVQLQINPIDGRFQNMGLKSSKIISEISDLFKKEDLKVSLIESSSPKTSNSNISS